MSLSIDSFALKSLYFELRYIPSFLLWDRAGYIAHGLQGAWPDLIVQEVHPNKQGLRLDQRTSCLVELDKFNFAFHRVDRDLANVFRHIDDGYLLIARELQLKVFSRVGLRLQFYQTCKNADEAADLVCNTPFGPTISGKHFNIEGKVSEPETAVRWQDEASGVLIRLRAQTRKVEFTPGIEVDPEVLASVKHEQSEILLDVDYYISSSTSAGQLKPSAWIKQIVHTVRRDSKIILGG
ncbi:hypothetical protein [Reyranella sp. CPCC 100927]|uniref:hypothetical protein n=1 Tax=Reyranella sp. CPCC 100927 TaxID=2599616 RepID=UPI0011B65DC3|nr:hypothetical protein [Reyranella sp. CPCC 100927]TWT13805.1 hypothetical protein FQU96_07810 [Reyranella sp. CPCC 100927]